MTRLSSSPPGPWRGGGDDRRVWIENFGRHFIGSLGKGKVLYQLGSSSGAVSRAGR